MYALNLFIVTVTTRFGGRNLSMLAAEIADSVQTRFPDAVNGNGKGEYINQLFICHLLQVIFR